MWTEQNVRSTAGQETSANSQSGHSILLCRVALHPENTDSQQPGLWEITGSGSYSATSVHTLTVCCKCIVSDQFLDIVQHILHVLADVRLGKYLFKFQCLICFYIHVTASIPKWETCSRLQAAAPPAPFSEAVLISMATAVPARRRVSLLQHCTTGHSQH